MMMSIVSFELQRRWTLDEAASVFESTAPKYLGKPGLIRKHYFLTEDGAREAVSTYGRRKPMRRPAAIRGSGRRT